MRHHTLDKARTKKSHASSVMQALSQVLQTAVLKNAGEVWYEEPEHKEVEEADDDIVEEDFEKQFEEEVKKQDKENTESSKDGVKLTGLMTDKEPAPQEVRENTAAADFIPAMDDVY